MAAIDIPMVMLKSDCESERGPARGPGERAFVSETWENLKVMVFKPGAAKVAVHGRAFPAGYRFTGVAALWTGRLMGAAMHRGGETHAWASHPLVGKDVAWVEAQVQTPWGLGYTNVTGWGQAGAMFGLVPHGLRLAWQGGEVSPAGNGTSVGCRIQLPDGGRFEYQAAVDGFEDGGVQEAEGLWDGARITGSFSFVSAGLVRISGGQVLWIKRPGHGVSLETSGLQNSVLGVLGAPAALCHRVGTTVVVRAAPECVSGTACGTGWSMIEPG
jgi:hypothetical protein